MTRPHTARRINAGEQEFSPAMREFLEEFYGALRTAAASELIAAEPEPIRDPRQHAFLGAAGEHLARPWNLAIPAWTEGRSRFLKRPYFTTPLEGLKAMLLVESPLAFRRRLIVTEAVPLRPRPHARAAPAVAT
jgi:hypothetical protein